jgi:NAD(P)-dependent dehydrogenase (short-subunit alcohol dehydrogenase family)
MSEVLDTARKQGLHDRIVPVDCDVTQWRDCTNATKTAIDRFGAVHGLVNNAGVGMRGYGYVQIGAPAKFYEHDVDAWRRAIDANVNGPFMMAKAVAPALVAQGWGRIVNHQPFHHGDGRIFALRAVEGRARSRDRDLG